MSGRRRRSVYHGLLLLDKASGPTSHDLVAAVRRLTGQSRVGHCGTLDPMATGLMLILLGEATKLAPWLVKMDKLYVGRLELGLSTDTDDIAGAVLTRKTGPWPAEAEVRAALQARQGLRDQLPPLYSAVKINGRPAHRAARAGEKPDLQARAVTAFRLELTAYKPPSVDFSAEVSSGYYIRSLARDLGGDLGPGACLTALRRERVGNWSVERAASLQDLQNWRPEDWAEKILPPAAALPHWPAAVLAPPAEAAFRQGRPVPAPEDLYVGADALAGGQCKILDEAGRLVGLAQIVDEGRGSPPSDIEPVSIGDPAPRRPFLRPLRVFNFGLEAEK